MHTEIANQAHRNLEISSDNTSGFSLKLPNDMLIVVFSFFEVGNLQNIIVDKISKSFADSRRVVHLNNGFSVSDLKLKKEGLSRFFERQGINITSVRLNNFDCKIALNLISLCPILKHLVYSNSRINTPEIENLTKLENLDSLSSLNLSHNEIDSDGAKVLTEWPALKNLKFLNLAFNNIGELGAEFLSSSKYVTQLQSLDLTYNQIGNQGVKSIAQSVNSQHLTSLRLNYNCAGLESVYTLIESKYLTNLVIFAFANNYIGEEGGKLFYQTDHLKQFDL
jgi:Ran GTPase-activating protein (RanGAP) involved in mRNA processing and transport